MFVLGCGWRAFAAPGAVPESPKLTADLKAGKHTATITVTASGATNSPKKVPVTLTVRARK